MTFTFLCLSERVPLIHLAAVTNFSPSRIGSILGHDWSLKTIFISCHLDRMGTLHEFDCRRPDRAEAGNFVSSDFDVEVRSGAGIWVQRATLAWNWGGAIVD